MAQRVGAAHRHVVDAAQPDDRDHEPEAVAGVQIGAPLNTHAIQGCPQLRRLEQLVDDDLGRLLEFPRLEAQAHPQLEDLAGDGVGADPAGLVRWGRVEKSRQVLIVRHHLTPDFGEHLGVVLGEAGDASVGLLLKLRCVDDEGRPPVGERDTDLGLGLDHASSEAG